VRWLCDVIAPNVEGVRITVAVTRRSRSGRSASNLSALSIEDQATIETAWSSLDHPIGESKDHRGRMGAFPSLSKGAARQERE
jgi:hypothetical protein